eukprot:6482408-Amphidinium_carterae.2
MAAVREECPSIPGWGSQASGSHGQGSSENAGLLVLVVFLLLLLQLCCQWFKTGGNFGPAPPIPGATKAAPI